MASVKTCSFLSPPIVYICSWDLNISCKLKCSLNPTVLFPSLDEYRRIENNVRKPLRLFLDLFVNGFPSPTLAKFLLKLITKGCKTCPLYAVGSDFGWREGLPRFNCSVKQIASLSLQRAQFYAHVKLWLWFKEKSGSWRELKCTFLPVTVWSLHLPDNNFMCAVSLSVCPKAERGSPASSPAVPAPTNFPENLQYQKKAQRTESTVVVWLAVRLQEWWCQCKQWDGDIQPQTLGWQGHPFSVAAWSSVGLKHLWKPTVKYRQVEP